VTALVAALRVYPHCDDFLARKSLDDSIKGLPDGLLLGVGTSHQTLHELWSGMLRGTIHNRDECLKGLQSVADLATKIGGESTAASTARAFIDVCDWFS